GIIGCWPAANGGQVRVMGNTQRVELFVKPVSASVPAVVFRVGTVINVRRIIMRRHMHDGRVLPALLLAVVHVVERLSVSVELMKFKRRRHGRNSREERRMLEREPQGSLAAHADAMQSHGTRAKVPALENKREQVADDKLLCGELGI